MQHTTFGRTDVLNTGNPPVSLSNTYLSPTAHHRTQTNMDNNGQFLLSTVPQSLKNINISSPPGNTQAAQHMVEGSNQNQEIGNNCTLASKDQWRTICVTLVERGEVLSRLPMQFRVIIPLSSNHGGRERLQIFLTGHPKVEPEEISNAISSSGSSFSGQDMLEMFYFTEVDYRNFRQQQGLFVELKDFPSYIDKEMLGTDRISVELSAHGESSFSKQALVGNCVLLQFVEITPFKRNVHISVQLNRGTDNQVCKHLASQIRIYLTDQAEAEQKLTRCQEDLEKTINALDTLKNKDNEYKMKQIENEAYYKKRLEEEVDKERQRYEADVQKIRNDATNMSNEHGTISRRLQNQVATLEYENKDLSEKRHRNECTIRGLQEDNKRLEIDLQRIKEELQNQQRQKEAASENRRDLDASAQRMKGEIDALKQERFTMTQEINKQNDQLQKILEEKIMLEREVTDKDKLVTRRETQVKTVTQELYKANATIKQFQEENRKQNMKVKVAQDIINSQEKVVEKKDLELEDVRGQLKDENEANRTWKVDRDQLIQETEKYKADIELLRKNAKTSESVIQWLNKQLTNAKLRDPGFRMAPPPKNLSLGITDISMPTISTMQPSMATEQKNDKLVSSTPIQNTDNPKNLHNEKGKENDKGARNIDKNQLDPKYLLPSKSREDLNKHKTNASTMRKNSPSTGKQQSVYFS